MGKLAGVLLLSSTIVGGSALAAERAPSVPAHCRTIAELKSTLKDAQFAALDAGQFHFMQGVYLATPPVTGMPAADGAFLVWGKAGSIIIWMQGKCVSTTQPTVVGRMLIDTLRGISSGAGEKDSKDELHL